MPPKKRGKKRGGNSGNPPAQQQQQQNAGGNKKQGGGGNAKQNQPAQQPQQAANAQPAPAAQPVKPAQQAKAPQQPAPAANAQPAQEASPVQAQPAPPSGSKAQNGGGQKAPASGQKGAALTSGQLELVQQYPLATRPGYGSIGRSIQCSVNHWRFKMGAKQVYQYDTLFEPDLEAYRPKCTILENHLRDNQFLFDGKMLFTVKKIPPGKSFEASYNGKTFRITIQETKVLDIANLEGFMQVYNILFRKVSISINQITILI